MSKNSKAISLKDVSKKYILHHDKPTFIENFFSKNSNEEFWALKDVNLEVGRGESLGIIGPNGSGKTTLLEIIAGITTPTKGSCKVEGNVVSLISLLAGFQPDLTGRENITLNGLLMGMSRTEAERNYDNIISFAEIENFIDSPLYTYSSGMMLRLGYSIAVHTNPDIVLIDEMYSVGDKRFNKKSNKKMSEIKKMGKTLVLVSHNLDFILKTCDRSIYLERGTIRKIGRSSEVIKFYKHLN